VSKALPHLIVGRALVTSLLVCGLGSAITTVVPVRFGNVDWEFGTLGELAANGALPLMGLSAMVALGLYERRNWVVGTTGVLMLVLGLAGFASMAVLVTDAPIVLNASRGLHPVEETSVKVVLAKSVGLLFLFSIGLLGTGIGALRSVQRGR